MLRRSAALPPVCVSQVVCSSGSASPPPAQPTGLACTTVNQCYPGIEGGALQGQAACLTQVPGGYCTHTCTTDSECCAIAGECGGAQPELCGPVESTHRKYCFLTWQTSAVNAAGVPVIRLCV